MVEKTTLILPDKPEKMFQLEIIIFEVPASKIADWIKEVSDIQYETALTITEVDTFQEDPTQ